MLKVGLVGVGGISSAHIPSWDAMEETELVAVCDIRPEQMEKYPDKRHYTDFNKMLEEEELDIIDICLPTYLHVEYALKSMKSGINVICEKPVSLNKDEIKKLYDTAKENNVKFMIAQVLRFWREYLIAKNIYDTQKYGKLLSGKMSRLGQYPARSWDNWMMDETRSGLVPFDLHIHDLDFLVFAFGAPKNKTCFRSKRSEQDYLNVIYEFEEFFINTEASWYAASYPFSCEFRFQFEKAVVAFEKGKLMVYECGGKTIDYSAEGEIFGVNSNIPKSDAYANEIRYFTDCVLNDKPADIIKPDELETVIDILNNL